MSTKQQPADRSSSTTSQWISNSMSMLLWVFRFDSTPRRTGSASLISSTGLNKISHQSTLLQTIQPIISVSNKLDSRTSLTASLLGTLSQLGQTLPILHLTQTAATQSYSPSFLASRRIRYHFRKRLFTPTSLTSSLCTKLSTFPLSLPARRTTTTLALIVNKYNPVRAIAISRRSPMISRPVAELARDDPCRGVNYRVDDIKVGTVHGSEEDALIEYGGVYCFHKLEGQLDLGSVTSK